MASVGILFFLAKSTAQLDLPSNSQKAKVYQEVGIMDISISYSRPSVREREVWGKLVPYGKNNQGFIAAEEFYWGAGADENTVIHFSDDVKIEGKDLPAEKYGLHMVLHENDKATIIFSKNHTAWGSYFYEPSEDALRVDVKTNEIPHTEFLSSKFIDVAPTSTVAALNWEKKQIPF